MKPVVETVEVEATPAVEKPAVVTVTAEKPVPETANPVSSDSDYSLNVDADISETPSRIYVDFTDSRPSANNRVSIARAAMPDSQLLMWLNTNGTQDDALPGSQSGRLGFLQAYIGTGSFEARLFVNGNLDKAVQRRAFFINDDGSVVSEGTSENESTSTSTSASTSASTSESAGTVRVQTQMAKTTQNRPTN